MDAEMSGETESYEDFEDIRPCPFCGEKEQLQVITVDAKIQVEI